MTSEFDFANLPEAFAAHAELERLASTVRCDEERGRLLGAAHDLQEAIFDRIGTSDETISCQALRPFIDHLSEVYDIR